MNVLYETDASGNVVRSYIYGENGQLLAMKKGSATYFYHYNAHGDVIALTEAQGNIAARYQYDTWGNILSQSGDMAAENPYRYAGYQYDNETGLYYLIARYFHPERGVFLSLDPDPRDDDDILTQNGYTYANNDLVMLVDPDRHRAKLFKDIFQKIKKTGFKIYKIGRIKGANDSGKGYWGVLYSTKNNKGKRKYRSIELHPPHNNHGYHLQSNKFTKNHPHFKGKFYRSGEAWRITIWKVKNRKK
ncbi:RHS repeat domain-containing protein [Aeribacillus composti]